MVSCHVYVQTPLLGESQLANGAHKFSYSCVFRHVRAQRCAGHEALVTVGTVIAVMANVEVDVAFEPGLCGYDLATDRAGIAGLGGVAWCRPDTGEMRGLQINCKRHVYIYCKYTLQIYILYHEYIGKSALGICIAENTAKCALLWFLL